MLLKITEADPAILDGMMDQWELQRQRAVDAQKAADAQHKANLAEIGQREAALQQRIARLNEFIAGIPSTFDDAIQYVQDEMCEGASLRLAREYDDATG